MRNARSNVSTRRNTNGVGQNEQRRFFRRSITALLSVATVFTCSVLVKQGADAQGSTVGQDIERQKLVVNQLQSSHKVNAQLADALYDLGVKYHNSGDYADAAEYFRQSLAVEQQIKRPGGAGTEKQITTSVALAMALLFQRKFDEAKEQYENAIRLTQEHGDKKELPLLYSNFAMLLEKSGNTADAEKYARRGLQLAGSESPSTRAILLRTLGTICHDSGRLDEGIGYFSEAAKLLANDEHEDQYFNCLQALGAYYSELGRIKESDATYKQLIERVSSPPDPQLLMAAHLGMAENAVQQSDWTAAQQHYQEALNQAKDAKSPDKALFQTYNGLGVVASEQEHFPEAESYHKKAIQLASSAHNVSGILRGTLELSTDYLLQGRPESSLQTITTAEKTESKDLATADPLLHAEILTLIGRCYRELGQIEAAAGYYKDAIQIYQRLHRPDFHAMAINSLATLYLDTRDFAKFQDLYDQAVALFTELHDQHEQARLDYTLAQSKLLMDKCDANQAIPLYQAALDKLSGSGDSGMQSAILRGLGLAYYLNKQYDKSLDAELKALHLAGDSSSTETQWGCNLGVGKAYKALGQNDQAEPYLRKAVAIVEKERSSLSRDSFKTYNLDLRRDCFYELVDLLSQTNRPWEALEIAERGKSRAFLDMLANRHERSLDTTFSASNGVGATSGAKPSAGTVLVASADVGSRSVSVTGRPNEIIEETALSPENAKPPTIDELKDTIRRHGSTCLEYMATRDKLYTWIIDPSGNIHQPSVASLPADFHATIEHALSDITANTKSPEEKQRLGLERQQYLRKLYDILIKPVEAQLPSDKNAIITIVPHSELFRIPFAALIDGDGSYLIEKHGLGYAPAVGVLRATQKLAAEDQSEPHKLLALGNPITKQIAFLGALPYAEKEVHHIASLYPAGASTVEVGAEANKKNFEQLLPQAAEIHLATHGLVDEEHPMKSAVVLAPTAGDDGLLTVSDIITLKNLKARLVVLSACQTGRGKITGDGVVGLSRAFIIAGTPSVLVSQWNVDDIMTEFQMSKFYEAYLKGTEKAQALRNAQLATIKFLENREDEDTKNPPTYVRANPRFWAAFQLIGESK